MGPQQLPSLCLSWPLEWTKAPLGSMGCGGQGESHSEPTVTPAKRKQQNIERCKREVAISDKAHLLVENAIKALMQLNGVDRETAERAIRGVMGGV